MFGIFSKQIIIASILISSFVLTACGSDSSSDSSSEAEIKNAPPVAVDDNFSVSEGGTLTISSVIGTLANDSDPENDTLTAILVDSPSFASGFFVLNSDGSFSYTHDGSENQSDSFSYQAFDGELNSNTVTVSISVSAVNEAPAANADVYNSVYEGGVLTVTSVNGVLVNDSDPENDTLTAILVDSPSFASGFFFKNDGTFSYTHDGTENLNDSFSYRAFDGQLNSNTVTVSVNVSAINDVPVAFSSCSTTAQTFAIDGTLNATDADSLLLTFSLGTDGSAGSGPLTTTRGSVVITNSTTGAYTYTPSATGPRGTDSFDFFVEDPDGGFATATETVIVDQKIMPLGDSITRGTEGPGIPPDNLKVGYRKLLYDSLIAAGYRFDYVGSDASTGAAVANFDSDNEGHGGWAAGEIAYGRIGYPTDGIRAWLDDNQADIILLHIGTNDGPVPGSTEFDTETILDEIDVWENSSNGNPVTVILAKIVNQDPFNVDVTSYNTAIEAMALDRVTNIINPAYPDDIIIVDMETALSYPADLGDAVHPNAGGYAKMAPVWHTDLLPVLDKCP